MGMAIPGILGTGTTVGPGMYHAYRIIRSGIENKRLMECRGRYLDMMVVGYAFNIHVWPAKLGLVWVAVLEFHRRPLWARLAAIRVNASMLIPPLWVRRIKNGTGGKETCNVS